MSKLRLQVRTRALAILCATFAWAGLAFSRAPQYSIEAIRFANSPGDRVAEMVIGAPPDEKIDTVYAMWLVRGPVHNILFDSGFHRERWFKEWTITDYIRPDD